MNSVNASTSSVTGGSSVMMVSLLREQHEGDHDRDGDSGSGTVSLKNSHPAQCDGE
jgi:hypothetical protein